jgi:DNA invertase Pin-like site-specific DNA recombinase
VAFHGPVTDEHKRKLSEALKGRRFPHHGKNPTRGERNPRAKLTREQADKIKRLAGSVSALDVAKSFGISREHVYRIWRGEYWAD